MVKGSTKRTLLGLGALSFLIMGAVFAQPAAYANPQDVPRAQGVSIAFVATGSALGFLAVA